MDSHSVDTCTSLSLLLLARRTLRMQAVTNLLLGCMGECRDVEWWAKGVVWFVVLPALALVGQGDAHVGNSVGCWSVYCSVRNFHLIENNAEAHCLRVCRCARRASEHREQRSSTFIDVNNAATCAAMPVNLVFSLDKVRDSPALGHDALWLSLILVSPAEKHEQNISDLGQVIFLKMVGKYNIQHL